MTEAMLRHSGIAAVLMQDNIDTDQIIPSREMKAVSRQGLGDGLFAGWRYVKPGSRDLDPGFVLNRPEQAGTTILVSGENFGCGSSREHAAWALREYGIRVIIAKSFGEIFHGNCIRNGILPITLRAPSVNEIAAAPAPIDMDIDLAGQVATCGQLPDWRAPFEIGAFEKRMLMEGLDPIDLTLTNKAAIDLFFERDAIARPWVYSAA